MKKIASFMGSLIILGNIIASLDGKERVASMEGLRREQSWEGSLVREGRRIEEGELCGRVGSQRVEAS